MSWTPPSNRIRNSVYRIRLLLISVLVIFAAPLRAQESGFQCEEHSLFVDRLSALPSQSLSPDIPSTKILASQNFAGFAKYGFESVRLIIRFDQDPGTASAPYPTGDIRISAVIQSHSQSSEEEIRASDKLKSKAPNEDVKLPMLLRARPSFPGSPAISFEQPEPGVPIFLVKFIGIAAAGGWGDVDSDNAMVLDLRHGKLSMPGAIGCVKDDFAGQGPGGSWASCHWDRALQDYDCETNEGGFLLVSGKKVRSKTDPPLVERIRFARGQSAAVVTGSIAAGEVKQYIFAAGKADQRLAIQLDSRNNAAKFHVVELGADPSREMGIDDCDNGCTKWQADLPDPAQYEIRVYTASQPAKYTLRISIR